MIASWFPAHLTIEPHSMAQRLDHVDAMRGIAAVLVMLQHSLEKCTAWTSVPNPVLETVNLGRFGVLLFFLISGFVVPFSLKGEAPIRRFTVSRSARLLPALWVSVAVFYVFLGPFGMDVVAANLAMLAFPFDMAMIAESYWSLSYELGFYIVCAILFSLNRLRSPRTIGSLGLLTIILSFIDYRDLTFFSTYFLAGLLLRLAFLERDAIAKPWAIAVCLGILLVAVNGYRFPVADPYFQPLAKALGAALPLVAFIAVVLIKPRAPQILLGLGTVSYSIYLYQEFSLSLLLPAVNHSPLLYILAVAILTICLALASYILIEAPCLKLGKRLAMRLQALEPELAAQTAGRADP